MFQLQMQMSIVYQILIQVMTITDELNLEETFGVSDQVLYAKPIEM